MSRASGVAQKQLIEAPEAALVDESCVETSEMLHNSTVSRKKDTPRGNRWE